MWPAIKPELPLPPQSFPIKVCPEVFYVAYTAASCQCDTFYPFMVAFNVVECLYRKDNIE